LNLIFGAPLWLKLVFACAMLAAAVEDAARLRISNITSLVVLVGAIVAAVMAGPTWSLWQNLAVLILMLILGTGAFAAGWLGGGDVKLFAAAGLWFDFRAAIAFVTFVFLAGGALAICYLAARPFRRGRVDKKSGRIPYGIAIALGAFAMILTSQRVPTARERAFTPVAAAPSRT
jgi:prepilin peptidase CpaA